MKHSGGRRKLDENENEEGMKNLRDDIEKLMRKMWWGTEPPAAFLSYEVEARHPCQSLCRTLSVSEF